MKGILKSGKTRKGSGLKKSSLFVCEEEVIP